ncbi:hypothetical protein HOY80DRAFT_1041664 [Tuber brumale]|nr:hypothetical protein HOY80DRAFT_1041664 [Tuber brumale]
MLIGFLLSSHDEIEEALGARTQLLRTQVATKIDLQVVRRYGADLKTNVVEHKPELAPTQATVLGVACATMEEHAGERKMMAT